MTRRFAAVVLCLAPSGVLALLGEPTDPVAAAARPAFQDPVRQAPPTALTPKQNCSTAECHTKITSGKFVHGPVSVQHCNACHAQADARKHDFTPIKDQAASCASCHELKLRTTVHKPLADGDCLVCHDPHHSETRGLLRAKSEKDLCAQCHEQTLSLGKKFVHGPVAAGACALCHDPHSSFYPGLLNKKGAAACLGCHTELEQALKGAQHWHRPVSENCGLCHDAHASDHAFQLKDEPRAMCLGCHEAKKTEIESATVFHEALTTKDGCKNCHKTHAAKFPKLLDKPVMELCLQCHDKPQLRPDGTVVTAIGQKIAESKFLHGPIREGDCSSCHNPHGSKNFSMLRQSYPKQFYAPFKNQTYNLCFGCHDGKVFTTKQTETLTDFRNGDLNLHFVHVNKDTKGRTCRACHNTHASNLPKHMAEKVPFGGWEIPINFETRPTGGSCAPGCHTPRTYDYVKAIPNAGAPAKNTGKRK